MSEIGHGIQLMPVNSHKIAEIDGEKNFFPINPVNIFFIVMVIIIMHKDFGAFSYHFIIFNRCIA